MIVFVSVCSSFQNNVEIHISHIQSGLSQMGNLHAFASSVQDTWCGNVDVDGLFPLWTRKSCLCWPFHGRLVAQQHRNSHGACLWTWNSWCLLFLSASVRLRILTTWKRPFCFFTGIENYRVTVLSHPVCRRDPTTWNWKAASCLTHVLESHCTFAFCV